MASAEVWAGPRNVGWTEKRQIKSFGADSRSLAASVVMTDGGVLVLPAFESFEGSFRSEKIVGKLEEKER